MKSSKSLMLILILMMVFLLGPFLVIILSSFGTEALMKFPPKGFSLNWYDKVLNIRMFQVTFWISLKVGLAATGTALLLGIPVSYAIVRFRFVGKNALELLFSSPAIIPGLVIGFSLLRFFIYVGHIPIIAGLYLGHTAILLPYTIRVVSASLRNVDPAVEEAAVSLGASRTFSFLSVILPNIRAGVVAALILAFIISFNNVSVSLFLTGPGVATLPIQMLVYMEYYFDPTIAALSSILIIVTVLIVQAAEKLLGISQYV